MNVLGMSYSAHCQNIAKTGEHIKIEMIIYIIYSIFFLVFDASFAVAFIFFFFSQLGPNFFLYNHK